MTKSPENIIPLKTLCAELKLDPREARKKLRSADAAKFPEIAKLHEPRRQWQWAKDSAAHKEAVKILTP